MGWYHTKNNDDNGQNNGDKDGRQTASTRQCEGDSNSCNNSTLMEKQCNDGNGNDITRMATLTTTMPM